MFRPGCSPLNRSPSHSIPHPLPNSAMARIASQRLSKRTFSQGSPGEAYSKLLLSTSTPTPPSSIAEWGRGGVRIQPNFFSSQQPFRSPDSAMFWQALPFVPLDLLPHCGHPPQLTCAPRRLSLQLKEPLLSHAHVTSRPFTFLPLWRPHPGCGHGRRGSNAAVELEICWLLCLFNFGCGSSYQSCFVHPLFS